MLNRTNAFWWNCMQCKDILIFKLIAKYSQYICDNLTII